jgi:FkbM family methyltransferase
MITVALSRRLKQFRFFRTSLGIKGCIELAKAYATRRQRLFHPGTANGRASWALRLPSTDVYVHNQIFVQQQYHFAIAGTPRTIVDAGANIGLFSIYMADRFPDARIIALEPEEGNFARLQANVTNFPNIIPVHAALWHEAKEVAVHDPGIGNWGFSTQSITNHESHTHCSRVSAMTVDGLMEQYQLDQIDILKIDIEGAEKEVFTDTSRWIERVNALIVELHEQWRPGTFRNFYNSTNGFTHEWKQGENHCLSRGNFLTPRLNPTTREVDFK